MSTTTPSRNPIPESLSQRVLFVDFDGVLHPTTHAVALTAQAVDAVHFGWVPLLDQVLSGHADVVIVVHSTWRHEYNLDELREVLGVLGHRVVGATQSNLSRYESIVFWLEQSPSHNDYRILDDDPSEFPDPPPPELILCNPSTGASAPSVQRAIADWLRAPAKRKGERR